MLFKDLTLDQKKKLLHDEYLKDGADEDTIAEGLIPDTDPYLTDRLVEIFDYTDETEVACETCKS
jgi:hypothetical protein